MNKLIVVSSFIFSTVLSGCSGNTFKKFDVQEGQSISIDASQRTILVKGDKVCAEPSPDAITALAAQFAAEAVLPEGPSARLSSSLSETATSISIRTATTQLVRDILYRICEGHMNGVVNADEVKKIINGMDNLTVALHAIEGLTRMQPAPAVAIDTNTNADPNKDLISAKVEEKRIEFNITGNNSSILPKESVKEIAASVTKIVDLAIKNP